jgi:anti-anti-sigma regulatory factor
MSTLRTRSGLPGTATPARPAPRFAKRRTKSWPCPSPARFSILYMYDLHDIVLQLSGDLDEINTPGFGNCADAAIAEQPRRLIVEMSALDTVDDPGLESITEARDRATVAQVDFILDSPNSSITTMLDSAGIREMFFIR